MFSLLGGKSLGPMLTGCEQKKESKKGIQSALVSAHAIYIVTIYEALLSTLDWLSICCFHGMGPSLTEVAAIGDGSNDMLYSRRFRN